MRAWPHTRFLLRSVAYLPLKLLLQANWFVLVRNVVVTGGSRGLGLGIVRKLTAEGYRAVAIARQMNDQLASTMAHAEQTCPGSLHFIPFDLGNIQNIPD